MQSKQKVPTKIYRMMRFGFAQIFIAILSFTCLQASDGVAKAILDQRVSLNYQGMRLKKVLNKIEQATEVTFTYSPQKVDDRSLVTINVKNERLKTVLNELLNSLAIEYKVFNDKTIVLTKATETNPGKMTLPPIRGKIIDVDGQPLIGATISVKGTSRGTVTDVDGNFTIDAEVGEVLVISYVGYEEKEIALEGTTAIEITLLESAAALDEIVVTALGIERDKRTLGYATSKVDADEVTVNRSPKFMDALQGKVPGLNITSMGSGPQGSTKIRIRGVSSFGGNNSPLIVVNGVPIDNTNFGVNGDISEVGSNRRSDSGDGLSSINPDDIVSMNVLKGAAASALYGARAKDGVIMITTKNRATGSGVQVEFNSNYTNDTPLDYTDYQYEYGQGEGGVRPNAPGPTSGVWSFGEKIQPGMTQILFDGLEVPYTAQPNKVRDYYDNGSSWANTLTISSGNENGGLSLSLSNLNSKAILPGSKYDRQTVNVGFTQNMGKFKISGNMNYSHEDRRNPPNIAEQDFSPVVIYTLASSMPLDLLRENAFDENGDEVSYSRFTNRTNPYFALSRFENNIRDRVYGNITARYDVTDWLYIQGRVGQDYYSRDVEYNLPTGSRRQSSPPPGFVNGQYVQDLRRFREINTDFLIAANRSFGDIGLNVNVGGNQMYRRFDVNTELGENFFTRGLYTIGNASKVTPNYSISERKVNSLYASTELSYKGFLYLNGTVRNDWFSTLAPANRSIVYPSITGSFVISEAFSNLPKWLSFAKVRVAYAEVGSDTDVAPYANNLFYGISAQQFPNPNGSLQPVGSINGTVVPNANLKPMRVKEREVGIELILLENITFEASYYHKLSSDQILQAQISDASGFQNQLINVGESENRGVETMLSLNVIRSKSFRWNTTFNATYNTSKVLSLGDDVDGTFITVGLAEFHGELRQVVGQPMAQLYGWGYLRDAQGRQIFDPNNGRPLRSTEQLAFGSALPKWWGGWSNGFDYKGLSLSFLIDFKLGHKMISGTHTNAYRHGLDKETLVGREQGYVVGVGVNPNGEINTAQSPVQTYYETIRSGRMSEQSVFNAGSWQFRQLSLGYDFSKMLRENKFIRGAKLSLVANNVAVIKKWVPHIHPDQNGIISDNLAGLEATGLPVTRSIGFNLNLKF
ncbi:MAG: SusC/RagA family TonB-linked outer membrane protein [Saprospiraceae bacterium]